MKAPLVITVCSSKKATSPKHKSDHQGSQSSKEAHWMRQIEAAKPEIEAASLYKGRAFSLARDTASELNADLMILSAGLGYVMSTTKIPSYDLTLGRGGVKTSNKNFDVMSWWDTVTCGPYSADITYELEGREFVLVCLTRAYAPLIANQLELRRETLKFRIFGEGLGRVLSPNLMNMVANYDGRLNMAGFAGTKSEFPQRAMRHYVSITERPCLDSLEADALRIEASLSCFPKQKASVPNTQLNDDEVVTHIRNLLYLRLGQSKLLRYFRDIEHIACEQSRFARLYRLAASAIV